MHLLLEGGTGVLLDLRFESQSYFASLRAVGSVGSDDSNIDTREAAAKIKGRTRVGVANLLVGMPEDRVGIGDQHWRLAKGRQRYCSTRGSMYLC
jgi:hypothetical protein